jgi:uncharacterized protein involved in exopolysaccharide biosynthesis
MVIEISTPGIAYVVFRQRFYIIAVLLVGFIGTVAYCLIAQKRYEADASLIVNVNRQLTGNVGASQSGNLSPSSAEIDEISNSYALVLQGDTLAEHVIGQVGLDKMYPEYVADTFSNRLGTAISQFLGVYKTPMERAVYHFVNKDIDVEVAKDSTVIQLQLWNPDPEIAKLALAAMIDSFLVQQGQIGRDPQLEFVRSQVGVYKKQVTDAQSAMEAFQLETNISSMDEENSYLLKQRSDLETQRDSTKVRIENDRHKSAVLAAQLDSLTETVALRQGDRDAALDAARTELVQLQVRQQTLITNFGADSPPVQALDGQIAKVEGFIQSYPDRKPLMQMAPNPTYQATQTALLEARADLEAAIKDLPVVQGQIDALSARLSDHSREQSTYQDLVREYQIDDENYRAYLQAVQQARIADDLNKEKATTVAVADPAHLYSALPTKPKTLLIVGAGTGLGLVLGLSLAFLRERLDERLNTPWQASKVTGLPVLGSMKDFSVGTEVRGS